MSEIVITSENISKQYQLGKIGYDTLKHDLYAFWSKLTQREMEDSDYIVGQNNKISKDSDKDFWALRNIHFEISQGESVGIIGKNGAGKSTLLKILSQITSPTSGEIKTKGKIASLLEVGTGFHPDLTGRENVYLNGAILGMKKREIDKNFDQIVDFSGIEKFIDTPVKRYSSGMYVRLAFAVAAHLDSNILIFDEVLAVGDAEFQKKCLGKMNNVTKNQGRTVLFVSHNSLAVKMLCSRCIILDGGKIALDSDSETAIIKYNELIRNQKVEKRTNDVYSNNRRCSGTLSLFEIGVYDIGDTKRNEFFSGEKVRFKACYEIFKEIKGLYFGVGLLSPFGRELVTYMRHQIRDDKVKIGESGSMTIEMDLDTIRHGEYLLYFWLGDEEATTSTNPANFDVVDDFISPLIIRMKNENEKYTSGFFSVKSKVL